MKNKHPIFEFLDKLAPLMPIAFYWLDRNGAILGGNELCNKTVSESPDKIIGKKYSEIYPLDLELAEKIEKNIKFVVDTGKTTDNEEILKDFATNKLRYYLTSRSPIRDENNVVIGVLATTIEITDQKEAERLRLENELQKIELQEQMKFIKIIDQAAHDTKSPLAILLVLSQNCMGLSKEKIFSTLKAYSAFIPVGIYWSDANNQIMGANKSAIVAIGGVSADDFIGKTSYELYPFEMADNIVKHNNEVMQTRKVLSQEESIIDAMTGKTKYFIAYKAPLYDDQGNVIGLIGTSVDITAEKNAERLKHENELQRARLEEQDSFRNVADQVVHDIRSPLASLLMIVKACEEKLDEKERIALREAAISIGDIANNLLDKYKKEEFKISATEERQPVMVTLALFQLLSEKKHQYKELPVKFIHSFCSECNFAFIKVEFTAFKRMMSNLVNNAAEALDGKEGVVELKLSIDKQKIKITILDDGKGMSQELIDKIMNKVAVTGGKKEGHGIGFTQVMGTLERNQGELGIKSKLGEGTDITVTFPTIEPPEWVAKEIKLNKGDTVVVLDDDSSIHHAWESRFKTYPEVTLQHFTLGEEAVSFINNFPKKEQLFLLADFELLKQELNGLHVIDRTKIKRSILVTSHYNNLVVRNLAVKSGTKILPKQLASEIPIEIGAGLNNHGGAIKDNKGKGPVAKGGNGKRSEKKPDSSKKVDLVLLDDDEMLVDALVGLLESKGKVVDKYYKPGKFLAKLDQYAKDIQILMDNDFRGGMSGIELAERLYKDGYTKLYLFSGKDFTKGEVPDYLMVISKTDTDKLMRLVGV